MGGIDVNNTSKLKECGICHYWYFLNNSFKFQPNICNRCYDLLMISMKLVILNIKSSGYCYSISGVSKSQACKTPTGPKNAEHYKVYSHI